MKKVVLVGMLLSVCVFVGCGGSTSSGGGTTQPATLVSIQVTPATPSIAPGATQQFAATGSYSDGTTKALSANWLSSSPAVASINTSGLATGVAPGTTTISASSGTITGTTTLTITNPLVSIAVTPAGASLLPNATQQYTAIGTYADTSTKDVTGTVTWTATTGATITSTGLATAVTPGTTSTIKATSGSIFGSTTLTVQNPLVSIAVTPTTASVAPNGTQQYTATGTYADASKKVITTSVTWIATSGATITAGGLATGMTPNSTPSITATQGSITSNTAILTVTNPLVSIAVTPATASVAPNGTQQYTAIGTYADNSTQTITSTVTWHATTGATITLGGLATGITPNAVVSITATQLSVTSNSATLTVTNPLRSIAVTPATVSLAPNATQQYTATGTYADSSTQNITSSVTWSASTGATITAGGLATAVTPNASVTIMATQGNISGTAIMTVTNPLVSIAVTPVAPSIAAGFAQQFIATGTYADNTTQVLTTSVTWASSNPSVATISSTQGTQGLANGLTAGTTSITAAMSGVTSPPDTLTVTSATLTSIAVTPASTSIPLGNQQQYTAIGTFTDNSTQDITNSVAWTSSDTTKVSIVGTGLATGVAVTSNSVTITATKSPGTPGTASLSVTVPVLTSITITPGLTTMAQLTSRGYTAIGARTNGSTLDVTTLATWTSSDITIATVGLHNGLVKAASVSNSHNSVTISVAYSGITQTLVLDVTNATVTALTVTPIAATIPVGVKKTFAATATFSDSSTQDVTSTAVWTSSDPTNAPIIYAGTASGVGVTSTPAVITAAFGGESNTAQLTVSSATLQSIVIAPSTTVLAPGSTIAYSAVGHYSDATIQYLSPAWNSSDTNVVKINASGVATGQQAGVANIIATYLGVTSNAAVAVVSQYPLVSIAVAPTTATVPFGVSLAFAATGTFQDQSTQNLTTNATWASSQSLIATVSNVVGRQGVATGVAPGQASITAVFAGQVGTANLTVSNATINQNGIAITPVNPIVTVGTPVGFTAQGTFSDSSKVNLTAQVTWSSSDATVATISTNGQANTAKAGTALITATFTQDGVTVSGTTILTVQ